MSKRIKSEAIFSEMSTSSRQDVIKRFMTELDMSEAGASTYYANAKKALTNPSEKSTKTPKSKTTKPIVDDNDDDGVDIELFTVCSIINELVDSSASYMSLQQAIDSKTDDQIVVSGVPELNTNVNQLIKIA